jgi:DnaJ-class molecular chaperone
MLRNSKDRGDLYTRIKVRLPKNLTDRERKLFQELAGGSGS